MAYPVSGLTDFNSFFSARTTKIHGLGSHMTLSPWKTPEIPEVRNQVSDADGQQPSIGDFFAELAATVPTELWDNLPKDLSSRFRHYSFNDE